MAGAGVKKFMSAFFWSQCRDGFAVNNKSALGLGMIVAGGIFQSVGTAGWIVTAFVLIVVGLFIQLLEAIKEK